ncbi:recombinase family protein [Paenibacillus sp. J2TS4]|uniref:recombinase family protein n=1 Tax=Paenibacillus sp. J2TS4 TaxID=2807194 RepID=UPI0020C011F8|nr:recombinase family protein [Paenibacillus sp. J2TS4]
MPEDSYDTDTSKSRFMFNLKAILAEDENAELSERIKLGLQTSAREGVVGYPSRLSAIRLIRRQRNTKSMK